MLLLSSSSLVVVVAAVVVVRRRHERDDVRLETTHSAHVYYELRRREKMRPKNAAINLEPILQREREREKKRGKIRAFCVTKERIGVYTLCRIDDFCAHHHHAKSRDGVEGGGGPVVVVVVVFCCWTRFSFL